MEDLDVKPFDGVQPFFLTSKLKLKKNDTMWFMKTRVGKNSLTKICKDLIEGVGIDAKGQAFSKKIPCKIGISKIKDAHIPLKKGCA